MFNPPGSTGGRAKAGCLKINSYFNAFLILALKGTTGMEISLKKPRNRGGAKRRGPARQKTKKGEGQR
jgi:hypothetical protein